MGKEMKITPADHWYGRCIKERAGWMCERCGKQYHEGDQGIHTSHFIGRGNWSVRLEPLNAFAHCYACHAFFEANPHLFVEWTKAKLGAYYDVLMELSSDVSRGKKYKQTKGKGEVAEHYKEQFEIMLASRAMGIIGRIDFEGWL